jgi:hypothetical protein
MPILELRVSSNQPGADALLQQLVTVPVDARWRQGEPDPRGRPFDSSGVNLCLADVEDHTAAFDRARERLSELQPMLQALRSRCFELQLDVGVTLDVTQKFTTSLVLDVTLMRALVDLEAELMVSVYATSDD